jgi:Fur family transcriptional regulator, iron response regulator
MNFGQSKIVSQLRSVGLSPTRHRVGLALLLFDRGTTRHVTAEQLFAEARAARMNLSLATVYNILHQFTAAGLLREVVLASGKRHFDSNITSHHHIISRDNGSVVCVDAEMIAFSRLPTLPDGEVIDYIDVIIWTRGSADIKKR